MSAEKVKPISPKEVVVQKRESLPREALEAFNELITQNFSATSGSATVKQKEAVNLMVGKGLKQDQIYDKGWLDVEDIYREAGWKVEYDKPAYNETYDAYFVFSKRRQKATD